MKKRTVVTGLITLVLCVVFFVSAQIVNQSIMKGDVNGDGSVNVIDAVWTTNIILGIPFPEPPASEDEICAADCNGDGNVNVLDVLLIVNVILYPNDFRFVSSCDKLDCDDSNTCTQDYCDSLCIQCRHTNLSSGTPCDDGDACTENDQCVDGNCQGTPKICNDGDPCTDDFCNPLTGECDSAPKSCDDSNPCTDDSCNPLNGECEYINNSVTCDDGDPCTENDICQNGSCAGTPKNCDDGNPCTNDSCNPLTGECEHTNNTVSCDDGDPCTENDICQNGSCAGTPKDCDDGNPNTEDSCNPLTGECEYAFTTCGTVTDIDGNTYQTIQISSQCWMAENLKVTQYRNGDPIPNVTDTTAWSGLSTGAYCNYNNDSGNVATYGRLYNWYAVDDSRNIAPAGWHVPTDAEWKQLEMYLGMSQLHADSISWRGTDEGGKMKETGTSHWNSPNTGATNESGFSALPGGYRSPYGPFYYMGTYAFFWSSTEYIPSESDRAWGRALGYGSSGVFRDYLHRRDGFSVRCVKD